MLKIRRPLGRLIFNMGIAIPGKTVFLIETAPRSLIIKDSSRTSRAAPDSKVHGTNMGPIWGRQDPGGSHVGPHILCNLGWFLLCQESPFRHWRVLGAVIKNMVLGSDVPYLGVPKAISRAWMGFHSHGNTKQIPLSSGRLRWHSKWLLWHTISSETSAAPIMAYQHPVWKTALGGVSKTHMSS